MNHLTAWLKASRLPAQFFIFPSLLLGQSLAYYYTGSWHWLNFTFIHVYGLCMHLFIVYANDYADYDTDRMNTSFTPFTGGSRVLVEGRLRKHHLLTASFIMATLVLILSMVFSVRLNTFAPLLLAAFGLLLMQAYSFNPIKLSYRGFGEVLQMLGVGIILPLIGFIAQAGSLSQFPVLIVLILLPAQYAMALSTSLPDEPSDRLSNKRTTVVILGIVPSRIILVLLYMLTLTLVFLISLEPINPFVLSIMAIVFTLLLSLAFNKNVMPGSRTMVLMVACSIIFNTLIVSALVISYLSAVLSTL